MDQKDIQSILTKVLNSNEFGDSPTYKTLLTYLVDASLQNKIPKEITVAIEVFEKDVNFNSNKDSTVRHHVHTLRKKLDKYYQNEGVADKTRFMIPKGHYEVKFIKKKRIIGRILLSRLSKNPWILLTLLLFLINLIFIFYSFNDTTVTSGQKSSNDFHFWSSFFKNNYPTSLIIGDDFLIDEYRSDLNRYRQIRDWEINSEADLNKLLQQYPQEKTWQSEINGIPPGMITNLFDLFSIIKSHNNRLSFNMSSELDLSLLKKHNIIYIGEFRNLRVLNKIVFSLPLRYQYQPQEKLFLISPDGDTTHTFLRIEAPYQQEDKFNVDYSVLLSMPGPSDENFLFIAGFGYGGRMERTRMLKDKNAFNQVVKELNYTPETFPQYFIIIFEVESIERTGFKNTLKYFKAYGSNYFK